MRCTTRGCAGAHRTAGPAPGRGLQLSVKKPRADEFLEAMKSEDGMATNCP